MLHPIRFAMGMFILLSMVVGLSSPIDPWNIRDRPMPFTKLWYTALYGAGVFTALGTWMVLTAR